MSGTHARRRPRRVAHAISLLRRPKTEAAPEVPPSIPTAETVPQAVAPTPSREQLQPVLDAPFGGRRRPMLALTAPPSQATDSVPSPDPQRNVPVNDDAEAVYRGIQAHIDQYTAPFHRISPAPGPQALVGAPQDFLTIPITRDPAHNIAETGR